MMLAEVALVAALAVSRGDYVRLTVVGGERLEGHVNRVAEDITMNWRHGRRRTVALDRLLSVERRVGITKSEGFLRGALVGGGVAALAALVSLRNCSGECQADGVRLIRSTVWGLRGAAIGGAAGLSLGNARWVRVPLPPPMVTPPTSPPRDEE